MLEEHGIWVICRFNYNRINWFGYLLCFQSKQHRLIEMKNGYHVPKQTSLPVARIQIHDPVRRALRSDYCRAQAHSQLNTHYPPSIYVFCVWNYLCFYLVCGDFLSVDNLRSLKYDMIIFTSKKFSNGWTRRTHSFTKYCDLWLYFVKL